MKKYTTNNVTPIKSLSADSFLEMYKISYTDS